MSAKTQPFFWTPVERTRGKKSVRYTVPFPDGTETSRLSYSVTDPEAWAVVYSGIDGWRVYRIFSSEPELKSCPFQSQAIKVTRIS